MSLLREKPVNSSIFVWVDDSHDFLYRVGGEDVGDGEQCGSEEFEEAAALHGV
jgi:hypothetical protein